MSGRHFGTVVIKLKVPAALSICALMRSHDASSFYRMQFPIAAGV